jgi:hypothetical protein
VREPGCGEQVDERFRSGIAMERPLAAGKEQMILCHRELATLCQIVL